MAAIYKNKTEAERLVAYMRTTFFRFLVSLRKITQDNKADVFSFVPDLPMDRAWDDDSLNKRYGLSDDQVAFMRSMIREMKFAG